MREMILFFVVFFLCLGSACADTYVSKENPNYAIDYITSGGQVFGDEGQCVVDRFSFDFPWMVSDGRVDVARIGLGQGENLPI